MCLLALLLRAVPEAPLVLGANRDEFHDRASDPPRVQPGRVLILCGTDRRAGGTWLGVNQFGLVVAVTNRSKSHLPAAPRSRGALCRELLDCSDATEAARRGAAELASGRYAGANLLCADALQAAVIHGGDEVASVPLAPGLHLLANGDCDDVADPRIRLAAARLADLDVTDPTSALDRLARMLCMTAPLGTSEGAVLRAADRGTVSSTLLAIARRPRDSIYRYAPGPPDVVPYDDYSTALRDVLQAE